MLGLRYIVAFFNYFSMMMPKWNINNELLYVHDMTGWWNLYIINRQGAEINLTPTSQEVGWPLWWLVLLNPTLGAF